MFKLSLCLIAALVVCAQANYNTDVLRSESEVNVDSFNIVQELADGQKQLQKGQLKSVGEEQALVQQGEFGWTAPEGNPISVSYVADENGYQPVAEHLPTPPPIPAHILKAIEYIQTHPSKE
ncbi:larval cuticle protein 4-like [Drosophila sulfurigaster albostrigata]|uniref:larval cuticle protein 4-like n=1 Tax=Drosophila sulfurigaster albostrigata TaxID=89887 RepID=UPI002D21B5B9|nr:larval cuticle protein 4-like [Drosophila sulfurigaster albostrigata]